MPTKKYNNNITKNIVVELLFKDVTVFVELAGGWMSPIRRMSEC
jgi:dethiobiotin synthetase